MGPTNRYTILALRLRVCICVYSHSGDIGKHLPFYRKQELMAKVAEVEQLHEQRQEAHDSMLRRTLTHAFLRMREEDIIFEHNPGYI